MDAGVAVGGNALSLLSWSEQRARLPGIDYCFTASICTTRRTFLGKPHSTP
jgi:hypothetical protein